MSVELDPNELGFKRPFTQEVAQNLRLRNPNSDPVAFKVKTTAPKQYCVRPNSGRIEAGHDVEVQVLLQAMKEDPPPDARCRDKFLVQSVAVKPESDAANVSLIWANIEQNAKSSIQEKKIRVTFLPADGAATTNGVASTSTYDDEPPAYSSPSPSAVTPQRHSGAPTTGTIGSERSAVSTTSDSNNNMGSSRFVQQAQSSASAAAAAVSASIPASQDELKQKLDDANAMIAKLKAQAADGLRQRKPQETVQKASESVNQSLHNAPAPGGVPVHIAAILCLVCFLLAYFFF